MGRDFAAYGRPRQAHQFFSHHHSVHCGHEITEETHRRHHQDSQGKFGPDTEWIAGIDYTVDPKRGDLFYAAIRKYWPGLKDGALQPGYAGIRPKISGPTEPAADFRIQGPRDHGVPGLVNLYGIESPGLTSSLPLADYAAAMV